jgi:hypothetical protein
VEEYRNEFLEGLVGGPVLVKRLSAPELIDEEAEHILQNPLTYVSEPLQSRLVMMTLGGYDQIGIVLRTIEEEPITTFVPWNAVIELRSLEDM